MNPTTCSEHIELILKRGGAWRNKQIEKSILDNYKVQYQSNTIAKFLSFMINAGDVESNQVTLESGKQCHEYKWIGGKKEMLRQVEKPCLVCGSWYRRGSKCNMIHNHESGIK